MRGEFTTDSGVHGTFEIDEYGGGGSFDVATVPAVILYIFGFLGIGYMLFMIPSAFLFMGLLALLLYSLPVITVILALIFRSIARQHHWFEDKDEDGIEQSPLTAFLINAMTGGGHIFKSFLRNLVVPYAHIFFNIFVFLTLICLSIGSVSEVTLIGFYVVCAYSMYYYPFALIRAAVKKKSKLAVFLTVATVVLAIASAVIVAEAVSEDYMPLAFFAAMDILGTVSILLTNLVCARKKKGKAIWLGAYAVMLAVVMLCAFVVLPQNNRENYDKALQCVQDGDFRQARELFSQLGRYEDAAEWCEAIRYVDLQVGEQLTFGEQAKKPESYSYKDLTWTVIAVEGDRALLMSDAILCSISSNAMSTWTGNNSVRSQLSSLLYCFDEEEQAQILPYTYTMEINGENVEVTDYLFLLSRQELETYCAADYLFSKKDTSYNDHQVLGYMQANSKYDYCYCYYVRDVDENGEWIVVDCENKEFITKNNQYVGIRPVVFISIDTTYTAPGEGAEN